jgi:serine/threonine protein kinase/lipopolysaccharide biosynthesis regulator YciM
MSIDLVRGELERLYSLDELLSLTRDLLGFEPNEVGGTASKASFARALSDHCLEVDAFDALVDALLASRPDLDTRLRDLGALSHEELKAGETFGKFTITKKLGDGPNGVVYLAKADGHDKVLKIVGRLAAGSRRSVRRYVTHVRLAASVKHESLAQGLESGFVGRHAWSAYDHVEGQPLGARIARTGPLHVNEARGLLRGVLGALGALHAAHLFHGAVKIENVLVSRGSDGQPRALLVDVGGGFLAPMALSGQGGPWSTSGFVKAKSPEQLRGKTADARSDLYTFGALLFEVLTGKTPFSGETGTDIAIAHLTQPAPAPSTLAPRGWVAKELDELCDRLMQKSPGARPKDVAEVTQALEAVGKPAAKEAKKAISEDDITARIDALVADPSDKEAALTLESAVELGADAAKVADAFSMAADSIEAGESEGDKIKATEAKKALLYRAARIFESAKVPARAEETYAAIVALDGEDEVALTALEELRRVLGKHEELVEMLLERSEKAESNADKARALHQIGQLYARELEDKEQGVFAYAQALSLAPATTDYAVDLERAAGEDMKLWGEALQILSQATTSADMPTDAKVALFVRLGHWYSEKVARPDMGLPCFQAVLAADPSHDDALDGMAKLYRRAQQWQELGQVLLRRADRAGTPADARNFRSEAADLLETRLGDPERARDLYEQIFNEDPGHQKTSEALLRIYQKLEDHAGYAKLLERKAEALRGDERTETLCKIAELYEDRLGDLAEATRRYELALADDPMSLSALRGLDRIYSRNGRYKELLENLADQIQLSATPRQKIKLYERIAGIHDEEYLDHTKAAEAYEAILQMDHAHEGSISALVRHYRALDRWEDVAALYERHLGIVTEDARSVELLLALGRVLQEQVGSPERARQAYERVLILDPNHARALESLAIVRAATGDAMAALSAIESLAAKATTPENKADLWLRAAKVLEDKGDRDGAIERYKSRPRRPAGQRDRVGGAAHGLPRPRRRNERRGADLAADRQGRRQPREGAFVRRHGAALPLEAAGRQTRRGGRTQGGRSRSDQHGGPAHHG